MISHLIPEQVFELLELSRRAPVLVLELRAIRYARLDAGKKS